MGVDDLIGEAEQLFARLDNFDLPEKVETLNRLRRMLHDRSPFNREPVDFVEWVPAETVKGNDYNPNVVAPPEMRLLQLSIMADGYTQPIVAWPTETGVEVVDGFHRHRVGKEVKAVSKRVHGYLPVTRLNPERTEREDRVAATIRHNRARGVHQVDAMSDLVADLVKRGRSDSWIAKELGMDADEVLRLKQVTGLAELFRDREFSKAWEADRG